VTAHAGETVNSPRGRPGEIVYASITIPRPLLSVLGSAIFKPVRLPRITLDGREDYRLNADVAKGPLVVHLPASAGISPQFYGGLDYRTLRLRRVPSPFRVDFSAMRVRGKPVAAPAPTNRGSLGETSVMLNGRRIPIVPGAVAGVVDTGNASGGEAVVGGWAADRSARRPAELVLAFVGRALVATVTPGRDRPDVAQAFATPSLLRSGFELLCAAPTRGRGVRIVAVAGGRASELTYGPGYALPR
jgi:hypothetical protein